VVDRGKQKIICTAFGNGRKHDFRLFKESKVHMHPKTKTVGDSGYQGIQKIHEDSEIPKKKSRRKPLTKEDRKRNKKLSLIRIFVENVLALIKRFKIVADKYRNRRKRFGLRFNLIAAICNRENAL
jgi:IS5 family transposase